jgi:hypothetical protein
VFVATIALLALAVADGTQAAQAPSASRLLHSALADAAARGSVHVASSSAEGTKSITFSDDVATNEGRQEITRFGGVQAHVLIIAKTAYFSGNQAALINYFQLPAAVARVVGSRWVSVPSPSSEYSALAADATLGSALSSITLVGPLTETGPTDIAGQSLLAIHGRLQASDGTSAPAILYVTRSNDPLPVRLTASTKASGTTPAITSTETLTDWGEHLALQAPTNVIPASKL